MRTRALALALVSVLVIAGAGMSILYLQDDGSYGEKERLATREDMLSSLVAIQAEAWKELSSANENLTIASAGLRDGLEGPAARAVLADLLANVPHAVDVVTIDITGTIVTAEPEEYYEAEGADISDQLQVQRMAETMMPVLSDVFVMVEGFTAADMEVPVFDADGKFNGSVSVALDMGGMLKEIVERSLDLERFQFTCLQTDGLEVYDTDEAQTGKNLFIDPAYQDHTATLEFMREVVAQSHGYGTYEYYRTLGTEELAEKEVYWASFGLHGAEWRLLVIHAL